MGKQEARIEAATGGLLAADDEPTYGAGDVPRRTDDAVGASAQVRANARTSPRDRAPISQRTRTEARAIMTRYPRARSGLLPMLHLVQSEQGYVTPEGVAMCAEELGLTKAEVAAVATFYTMFKRRPTGEYLVSVCTNTLCGFLGGEEIFAALKDYLDVGHDQTTADGRFTLEHAECLAACDYAPVVTVNYEFYDQQDTGSALQLVRDLQDGQRPAPTRGAALCSFREISRQLAGFYDTPIDPEAPSHGEPTLAGNRAALRLSHEAPAYPDGGAIVPPSAPNSASEQAAPDPSPEDGQTAHRTSTDKAVSAADTPAEEAGAGLADPDTNRDKLSPGAAQPHEPVTPPAPPTAAAAVAPATGAPTGPGSSVPPQARRTRTRQRSGAQAKIEPPDGTPDGERRS